MSYGFGYDIIEQAKMEDRQRVEDGLSLAHAFISSTSTGKLTLEIDRYGHIKMEVVVSERGNCNERHG